MDAPLALDLRSEVGRLEAVLLHEPGPEIENMAPRHAERALYSDILSRRAALRDYAELSGVLERVTECFQLRDLLTEVLADPKIREGIVETVCRNEDQSALRPALAALAPAELARQLIEGVVRPQDTLTRFLNDERYALRPLHNLFFMRDTGAALGDRFVAARMANAVREREALLVATVLRHHPRLRAPVVELPLGMDRSGDVTVEGGDLIVARKDLLIVGLGARTSPQAVDCIVSACHDRQERWDLVIQELPREPESFIHLDMVFTLLDTDACLVYAPVLLRPNTLQTVHMRLEGGRVTSITRETNLLDTLRRLGLELEPVLCGGRNDAWMQEREQWHSGANAFAVAPGQVMVYARNQRTVEELDRHGFAVIEAAEIVAGRASLPATGRAVVTLGGAELARGGGGCRCMTLPLRRAPVV